MVTIPRNSQAIATHFVITHPEYKQLSARDKYTCIEIIKEDFRSMVLFQLRLKSMCIVSKFAYECLAQYSKSPMLEGAIVKVHNKSGARHIFQSQDTFDSFSTDMKNASNKPWKTLGVYLNYPPVCVDLFHDAMITQGTTTTVPGRLLIDYHGHRFISSCDVLKETVVWLEENFVIPEEHKTVFTISSFIPKQKYIINSEKEKIDLIEQLTKSSVA